MKKICQDIYVPKIESVNPPCPDGYQSGECVIIENCIPGFNNKTANAVINELYNLILGQYKSINSLTKQINEQKRRIRALELTINNG